MLVFQVLSAVFGCLSIIFCIITFVLNRKDKAVKEVKENNYELIKYQLNELKDDVKAILTKLDNYETDIDERVDKAMNIHIKMYHTKGE